MRDNRNEATTFSVFAVRTMGRFHTIKTGRTLFPPAKKLMHIKNQSRKHIYWVTQNVRLPNNWLLFSFIAVAFIAAIIWSNSSIRKVRAASPASGTLAPTGPVLPFTGTWNGTATGGSSANGE